jgi:hypothetical protein
MLMFIFQLKDIKKRSKRQRNEDDSKNRKNLILGIQIILVGFFISF